MQVKLRHNYRRFSYYLTNIGMLDAVLLQLLQFLRCEVAEGLPALQSKQLSPSLSRILHRAHAGLRVGT
jgi:hypothetical protein